MEKRLQINPLIYLFLSSFIVLFVGMGLFPLLPLYTAQFGATKTMVGFYFATLYISNTLGSMSPAWLVDRISHRRLFILVSIMSIPVLFLLGYANAMWQVVFLTSILWYSGGLIVSLVGVFTGHYASSASRGRSFSVMSLPMPLGTLIGSAVVGGLVTTRGYSAAFTALGILWVGLAVIGLFFLEDKISQSKPKSAGEQPAARPKFAQSFYVLLGLVLLSTLALNAGKLGTSLSMQGLLFSPGEIASTATVSGFVAIPLTLLIGYISDRIGRERLLIGVYLVAAAGAVNLVFATQLWQFWLSATFLMVGISASGALSYALATDVLEPSNLSRGLSLLKGAGASASVIGFALTGLLMDNFGPVSLYVTATIFSLVAAYSLNAVGCKAKKLVPVPSGLHNEIFCM